MDIQHTTNICAQRMGSFFYRRFVEMRTKKRDRNRAAVPMCARLKVRMSFVLRARAFLFVCASAHVSEGDEEPEAWVRYPEFPRTPNNITEDHSKQNFNRCLLRHALAREKDSCFGLKQNTV